MPWNKYEAVILLEGYLEVKKKQLPRLRIVKRISNDLRQMAINQGIEIDAIYRNENGISFQMTSMASAYEMTDKGKPATKLFSEIADMYRNNNEMYKKILLEANEMILGSNSSHKAKADETVVSTSSIPNEIRDECNLILLENFEDGYRIGNYMHQMRFINLYNSNFNSQLDKQPTEIDDLLKSIGRLVDDRIFASDGNDANDIIKEVIECIKSTFDNGASSIFYECLYERFRDKLISEMNIYSSDTLKIALQSDNNLRIYSFNKTHIARIGSSNDIESEITKILMESHIPISYDDIQKKLWYIPYDSIRNAVGRIENAAYVGDSSFVYAPNFNISSDELSKLITAMHNTIYSKGYIVAKDLQKLYIKNCPFSAMDSSDYKDYAIREILRVLLKDKFHFSSSVISENGTALTYGDIYENYAKERDIVTVSELQELSSELGVQIYWDSIMNQMIRISPEELVNKRLFKFDIESIDKHLESICDGDYVLLKDIRLYLSFPPLNYKWNGFILYSYLLLFSRKFSIVRHGFVYSDNFGAMVKNTSPLRSYEQVAADVLSKDNFWNDEKSALKCIINAGLQKNNANKHIASIIKMAKQIRNNEGRFDQCTNTYGTRVQTDFF